MSENRGNGMTAHADLAGPYAAPRRSVLDVPFDGRVGPVLHGVMTIQNCFAIVGMFLFPAVLGAVAGLKGGDLAALYGATFIVTGIGSVLNSTVGLKLPIIAGPFAASLAGLVATIKEFGAGTVFGSVFIAAAIWALLCLPIPHSPIGYIARLFRDPIVYGGVLIISIGALTNITVVNWIGTPLQPGFATANLVGGAVAIVVVGGLIVLTTGFIRSVAMLIAIIVGAAAYAIFHPISFAVVGQADWFHAPSILAGGFGVNGVLVVLFFLLMLPALANAIGCYHVAAEWGGEELTSRRMTWGIFGLALTAMVSALFGTFYTSVYPDNLAIVRASRIGSRWITATAGALLIVLGFIPKFDSFFVAIPSNVIGAAAVVLFGILFMSGVAALKSVEWDQLNLLVLGLPLMLALGGLFVEPAVLAKFPLIMHEIIAQPLFSGPVLLLILHLLVNKVARPRMRRFSQTADPESAPTTQARAAVD